MKRIFLLAFAVVLYIGYEMNHGHPLPGVQSAPDADTIRSMLQQDIGSYGDQVIETILGDQIDIQIQKNYTQTKTMIPELQKLLSNIVGYTIQYCDKEGEILP